jgi:hypothetical protein
MGKRFWISFVAAFVVFEILGYLIDSVILKKTYESLREVWRPDMKLYLFFITDAIFVFFFVFVFTKGYEGKGVVEGLRYGSYIGLMVFIPMAYNQYAVYPIPYSLAWKWWVFNTIKCILAGTVTAAVYGRSGR